MSIEATHLGDGDAPLNCRRPYRVFALVTLAYLLLGVIHSIALPILEASDETWHFSYVRQLAEKRRLLRWDADSPASQESSHPPLYYAAAAFATCRIDTSNPSDFLERNPYWGYATSGTVNDNKNLFLHGRDEESFPWRDTALAMHVARLVNLAFGTLTVVFSYLLAREILRCRPWLALAAAALVAFNLQFLFVSSAVNNDAATSAFCTMALWLFVRYLPNGYRPPNTVMIGEAVGLTALCKVSALALLPLGILAIGLGTWLVSDDKDEAMTNVPPDLQRSHLTRFIIGSTLFLGAVLLVSGWWYARNAAIYGDPLGLQAHRTTWWAHNEPVSLLQALRHLPDVERAHWATSSWGNVHLPQVLYVAVRVTSLLGLAGLLTWAVRAWRARMHLVRRAWSLTLLGLWVMLMIAAILTRMQLVGAALGRLLFPAIAAISVLTAWGLDRFSYNLCQRASGALRVSSGIQRGAATAFAGGLIFAAVAARYATIRPAYAQPPAESDAEITSRIDQADIRLGDSIKLVGSDLTPDKATPGDEASVTLCWKAIESTSDNYAYFVHFLGPDETIVGARNTHPGLGRYPNKQWTPRVSFCDVVRVPMGKETPTPAVYNVEIGWYCSETNARLSARTANSNPLKLVTLGKIEIVCAEQPAVEITNRVNARVGNHVMLPGYGIRGQESPIIPSRSIEVTLYWQTEAPLTHDYTVFLHLAHPSSSPFAQQDGQPRQGTYPTSYWDPGLVITDSHTLRLPGDLASDHYPLITGMYRLNTGERLPAFAWTDECLTADSVPLTEVEILL